jgi:lysophospholipase L1-like esterase
MHLRFFARRGLAAGAILATLALAACGDDPDLIVPDRTDATAGARFNRYVAIGNSITAGYQSGGINDSTQQESFARLLAQQFGTDYRYASLSMPGCPPPTANFLTGARVANATSTTCALLSTAASRALNNVAIPGAAVEDPTASTSQASNTITTLILGGKTQVQRALDADPTFVTIWIGNNDALQPAATGLLTATAGVSRGLTDSSVFKQEYNEMLTQLTAENAELEGALISVVNTAAIPLLFPVAALFDPTVRTGFAQATGGTTAADITVLPNCGTAAAPANFLVSFAIAAQIRLYRQNPAAAGAHPPVISCGPSGTPTIPAPVGDIFMLSPAEQTTLATVVGAYNNYISTRANELEWAYVDVNPTLLAVKQADVNAADPRITTIFPRLDIAQASGGTRSPFGTWFSFDGAHPARLGHEAIANAVIAAINAEYGTTIPACTIGTTLRLSALGSRPLHFGREPRSFQALTGA